MIGKLTSFETLPNNQELIKSELVTLAKKQTSSYRSLFTGPNFIRPQLVKTHTETFDSVLIVYLGEHQGENKFYTLSPIYKK